MDWEWFGGEAMRLKFRRSAWLALVAMVVGMGTPCGVEAQEDGGACPPKTRVENVEDKYGKTVVVDPYRWLKDQESKETRAWIEAQDKCTESGQAGPWAAAMD
jgi:Prolyl oligopeptidase, N-terminal beta-propeller domain